MQQLLLGHFLILLLGLPLFALLRGESLSPLLRTPWAFAAGYLLGESAVVLLLLLQSFAGFGFSLLPLGAVGLLLWLVVGFSELGSEEDRSAQFSMRWFAAAGLLAVWLSRHLGTALFSAVTAWDARSIWFFHGKAFFYDLHISLDYLKNVHYLWSHPDYPPAIPLLAAFHALVLGSWDEVLCKSFMLLHYFAALMYLWYCLRRRGVSPLAIAAGTLLIDSLFGSNIVSGYADTFLALTLLIGVLQEQPRLRVVFFCFAALIKAEALVFVLLFYSVYLCMQRFKWSSVLEFMVAILFLSPWRLYVFIHDIRGEYRWSLEQLQRLSFDTLQRRAQEVIESGAGFLLRELGYSGLVLLIAAVALPPAIAYGRKQRDLALYWALWLLCLLAVPLIYISAPIPITWLLETSFIRVCTFPLMLAFILLLLSSAPTATSTRHSFRGFGVQ